MEKEFIESINPSKDENLIFIDLAGGTGDITKRVLLKYKNTSVKVIDINQEMLKEGKNSFKSQDNIDFICSSGESISITDNYADVVTVSFGIRNMTDRENASKSVIEYLSQVEFLLV